MPTCLALREHFYSHMRNFLIHVFRLQDELDQYSCYAGLEDGPDTTHVYQRYGMTRYGTSFLYCLYACPISLFSSITFS